MTRLLLLCCLATGCSMYWGGDDLKNDDCGQAAPSNNTSAYRDPQTGACIDEGGGYYCGCASACPGGGAAIGNPDWGQCYTSCDNLDESDCITTSGCHAAYVETVLGAPVSTHTFYGCWQTAPGGQATGSCSGLDAQSCSTRDNCSMVYTGYQGAPQDFERCFDETTTTDPGQCTGTLQCAMAPPPCPANTTAGIANGCWTGFCIPNAQCGSPDPGQCYAPVLCDIVQPSCPVGTLPGITNGCYSGFCIPTSNCEAPPCASLGTEATCEGRADCTPVYTGTNCTCTVNGCTCTDETYMSCESLVGGL
jgi:hypothetical protein